jgi:hypothetical protein
MPEPFKLELPDWRKPPSGDAGAIERGLRGCQMRFSEAGSSWGPVPRWVQFLIEYGFGRAGDITDNPSPRRISIISMPCESAAAGLVALGAVRQRLALDGAHDCAAHFQRIERLARERATHATLRHNALTGRFTVEGLDPSGVVWVRRELARTPRTASRSGPPRITILPATAAQWYFEGEPRVQELPGAELEYAELYRDLIDSAPPVAAPNLARSDSALCLAGRVAGESASRGILASIRFKIGDCVSELDALLTVQRWSLRTTISRITFFNSRTSEFDRRVGPPRLVVTDGDAAFLKAIDAAEFRESDVIGVIHRALERDRLEAIGVRMAGMAQWYAADFELLRRMPPAPRGITISTVRHR